MRCAWSEANPLCPHHTDGKLRPELAGIWGPRELVAVQGLAQASWPVHPSPCGAWNHSIQEASGRDTGGTGHPA